MSMVGTKLVMATSASITQSLMPGTSCAMPTAPIRFGLCSSVTGDQPGATLDGKYSRPALILLPLGLGPADTFLVQSVAICWELFGCDGAGLVVVAGGAAVVGLFRSPRVKTRTTTSATTASTATPPPINHGSLER